MNKKIIHSVFEQSVADHINAIAVEYDGTTMSYDALNKHSNQLAHMLRQKSVKPEDTIALFFPACTNYIVGLLGVLKAGAIFLPLDIETPKNRQDFIVQHAKPSWIVTDKTFVGLLPKWLEDRVVLLENCTTEANTNLDLISEPDDSCYLLFTSGSTGTPKAIVGRQKSLSHFIHWELKVFALNEKVRVSLLAAPTFDVSLRDIFVPLLAGGCICIPTTEQRSQIRYLLDWLSAARLTWVHCVPSLFRLLMRELESRENKADLLPHLQCLVLAGEPIYGRDVQQWRSLVGERIQLVNFYGPSETTLAKAFHIISEDYLPQAIVPIGQAISNAALLLLKDNKLCAIGEVGEIYIKTPFISKGYFADAELTDSVFVQNPLADDADIIYKTGDVGRYRQDRSVEYVGRIDNQVKVNGIRIELGEIEQAMLKHPAVRQAVVIARHNDDASLSLIAYYMLATALAVSDLRAHLLDDLPKAMLPAFFVEVADFTLNAHGKIDRNSLPEPEQWLYQQLDYQAPNTALETALASIWRQVLNLEQVGVNNSFIELGGDSLKAMRVVAQIYRVLDVEVSLKDFFEQASIMNLVGFIGKHQKSPFNSIPALAKQDHYALSHAQKRMWVLHQMAPESRHYNLSNVYEWLGRCDVVKLHQALQQLFQRHESLRTYFVTVAHEVRQCVEDRVDFELPIMDLSGYGENAKNVAIEQAIKANDAIVFNLGKAALLQVSVLKITDGHYIFLFSNVNEIS
jgi:amino acid adenylation domain-containing protein